LLDRCLSLGKKRGVLEEHHFSNLLVREYADWGYLPMELRASVLHRRKG
jgi:ribosomal protein S14